MSNLPASFDDFMNEISASLSNASGEAALRRINTERVLRLVLEDIVEKHPDLQIRVLVDSRIAGQAGADILIQIDDYEIRLELLDVPNHLPKLSLEQVEAFRTVFEENPSTETIILTWTTEDLKAEKLNLNRIAYLKEHPEKLSAYLAGLKPLQTVLEDVLSSHMKVWDTVLTLQMSGSTAPADLQTIFERHLKTELHKERDRSYRTEEKKQAALKLPAERELTLMTTILNDALQGMPSKYLETRLAQLPKRGAR